MKIEIESTTKIVYLRDGKLDVSNGGNRGNSTEDDPMKALSLYEPWATLIAIGAKRFETRSWSTTYRGPLLICANKVMLPTAKIIGVIYRAGLTVNDLNPGRAVCIADLVEIYKTDDLMSDDKSYGLLVENETFYGDFSPGRFAWKLENVRKFKIPFPVRGRQRLFEIPDKLIEEVT